MTAPFLLLRPGIFTDGIAAGFSIRHHGVSPAPFDSLNVGLSTGDDEAHVRENRRRLCEQLGFSADQLALAGQVHGADVKAVDRPGLYPGYDGLVTQAPGLLLGITAADCAAVLLADPDAGVIGACHSGWRGTVARITEATVAAMERLGARPDRLQAYISPCISAPNFEVGPEVAAQFDAAYVVQHAEWPRPHVDLKAAIADQLQTAGVAAGAIEVSPHCTAGETDRFFSYRAEAGATGRMMGVIGRRT